MTQYSLPWMNEIMKPCTYIFTLKLFLHCSIFFFHSYIVLYPNREIQFSVGQVGVFFFFLLLWCIFVEMYKLQVKDASFVLLFCLKLSPNVLSYRLVQYMGPPLISSLFQTQIQILNLIMRITCLLYKLDRSTDQQWGETIALFLCYNMQCV